MQFGFKISLIGLDAEGAVCTSWPTWPTRYKADAFDMASMLYNRRKVACHFCLSFRIYHPLFALTFAFFMLQTGALVDSTVEICLTLHAHEHNKPQLHIHQSKKKDKKK